VVVTFRQTHTHTHTHYIEAQASSSRSPIAGRGASGKELKTGAKHVKSRAHRPKRGTSSSWEMSGENGLTCQIKSPAVLIWINAPANHECHGWSFPRICIDINRDLIDIQYIGVTQMSRSNVWFMKYVRRHHRTFHRIMRASARFARWIRNSSLDVHAMSQRETALDLSRRALRSARITRREIGRATRRCLKRESSRRSIETHRLTIWSPSTRASTHPVQKLAHVRSRGLSRNGGSYGRHQVGSTGMDASHRCVISEKKIDYR